MTKPGLHVWHPFTQEALDPAPLRVIRAEGVYLYIEDGRRVIDGISSWWVNLHGHCHPAIMGAIAEQAAKVDHVLLAGFTHEAVEELSLRLSRFLPPGLDHIFFSDNGSTAVEVALKMALQYWENTGQTKKRSIVALEHAYHGDTAGAMSVSADSSFTDPFATCGFPCSGCTRRIATGARWGRRARRAISIASTSWRGCWKKRAGKLRR